MILLLRNFDDEMTDQSCAKRVIEGEADVMAAQAAVINKA
jgi:hypothetical protein